MKRSHTLPALLCFHAAAVVTLFVVSGRQKWQRRFFILYEDGGLSFALDELVRTENDARSARGDHAGIFRPDVVCRTAADDLGLARPLMPPPTPRRDPLKSPSTHHTTTLPPSRSCRLHKFWAAPSAGVISVCSDSPLQPSTLPQGTVNMSVCTDISDAEPRTGQRNALRIATPEQEIFIRGDNKEIVNGSVRGGRARGQEVMWFD